MIKEIKNHIEDLSKNKKQGYIVSYLKDELSKNTITAQEIYDYALQYYWDEPSKNERNYVISPKTINRLGLVLSNLDPRPQTLEIQFYQLSGNRGYSLGYRNYALMLFYENQMESALTYINKALTIANAVEKQTCQFSYAQILEANNCYSEAMQAYAKVIKTDTNYIPSVEARARLLKLTVSKYITSDPVNALNAEIAGLAIFSQQEDHSFTKFWHHDDSWFDSVDLSEFNKETKLIEDELETLLAQKRAIKEKLEKNSDIGLLTQYDALEKEIEALYKKDVAHYERYKNFLPNNREELRRHLAEKFFFNAQRNKKKAALTLHTEKVIDQRFNLANNNQITPIDLTGLNARRAITAEEAFQTSLSSLMKFSDKHKKIDTGIPTLRSNPWQTDYATGENTFGPVEHYTVGTTSIKAEHRSDPKGHRLGDSFLEGHGTYNQLYNALNAITLNNSDNEKQLATYMIRYGRNHQPITLPELQAINPKTDILNVNKFNQICFLLLEKEQSQWHSATNTDYHLGMTVAQARCLIMLQAGVIRFEQVFKNSAVYGVYSQIGMIDYPSNVKKACAEVDKRYKEYLQTIKPTNPNSFFQKAPMAEKPHVVLTRHQAHEDLRQVYGGDSDTDGEGYESDLSMTL